MWAMVTFLAKEHTDVDLNLEVGQRQNELKVKTT